MLTDSPVPPWNRKHFRLICQPAGLMISRLLTHVALQERSQAVGLHVFQKPPQKLALSLRRLAFMGLPALHTPHSCVEQASKLELRESPFPTKLGHPITDRMFPPDSERFRGQRLGFTRAGASAGNSSGSNSTRLRVGCPGSGESSGGGAPSLSTRRPGFWLE